VASGARNIPAERSVLLAVVGFAIFVVRPLFILPKPYFVLVLAAVPGCGLAATLAGVAGIKQARAVDGPKVTAVLGLLGGLFILVVSVAFLLFLWALSRENWQF
jgi:hypothetical protein